MEEWLIAILPHCCVWARAGKEWFCTSTLQQNTHTLKVWAWHAEVWGHCRCHWPGRCCQYSGFICLRAENHYLTQQMWLPAYEDADEKDLGLWEDLLCDQHGFSWASRAMRRKRLLYFWMIVKAVLQIWFCQPPLSGYLGIVNTLGTKMWKQGIHSNLSIFF